MACHSHAQYLPMRMSASEICRADRTMDELLALVTDSAQKRAP